MSETAPPVMPLEWQFPSQECLTELITLLQGGGPRVVVSTPVFHARVRDVVLGLGGLK